MNITETIRCIAAAPFGDGYDCIIIGTDSSVICYDVHNNLTVFRNDVPDGVSCFVVSCFLLNWCFNLEKKIDLVRKTR